MKILIVLVGILLVLLYLNSGTDGIEHYDIAKRNMNINACAETCKTAAGCYGFAYNKDTGSCYLSQSVITGKPTNAIYKDEYSTSNVTCNKYNPIETAVQTPTLDERKGNSLYVCSESSTLFPQFYLHNNGKFTNLGEGRNIDEIFDVDVYSTHNVEWPARYDVTGELALLTDNKQKYNVRTISDVEKILLKEETPTRAPITGPPKTALTQIKQDFGGMVSKALSNIYVPYDKRDVPAATLQPIYQQKDGLNAGQYLKPYGCLRNISNQDCLKYCNSDVSCVGVEWNPNYLGSKDVCCPYKTIGDYARRDITNSTGKFYEKKNLYEKDNKNIYVSVL